jgi:polyhydroxyalkanoate synthesis regulator phasin
MATLQELEAAIATEAAEVAAKIDELEARIRALEDGTVASFGMGTITPQ